MKAVSEIEKAIERLSAEEQIQVRDWILQKQPLCGNEDIVAPRPYRQKVMDTLDLP